VICWSFVVSCWLRFAVALFGWLALAVVLLAVGCCFVNGHCLLLLLLAVGCWLLLIAVSCCIAVGAFAVILLLCWLLAGLAVISDLAVAC
jgi:hypothetical protein